MSLNLNRSQCSCIRCRSSKVHCRQRHRYILFFSHGSYRYKKVIGDSLRHHCYQRPKHDASASEFATFEIGPFPPFHRFALYLSASRLHTKTKKKKELRPCEVLVLEGLYGVDFDEWLYLNRIMIIMCHRHQPLLRVPSSSPTRN